MELPRINLPKGGKSFTTKKIINSNFGIKNIFLSGEYSTIFTRFKNL